MTENSFAHPYPIQAADRLTEALRNELLEYGHLLKLLRAQHRIVLEGNLIELPKNINGVNQQTRNIIFFENKESIGVRKHFAGWRRMQIYLGDK